MERIYHHISIVRNKLLCFNNSRSVTTRKVNKIDPLIRNALVTTIQDEMNHNIIDENNNDYSNTNTNLIDSLQQIDNDIQIATIQLNNAIEKEKFISLRSHQYNKVLDELAYRIKVLQQQQAQQVKNQQQKDNQEEVDDDNEKEEEIEKVDIVDVDDIESNVVVCTTRNDNNDNNNNNNDTNAVDRNYDNIKNDIKFPVDDTTTIPTTNTSDTTNNNISSSSIHIEQMIMKWETNMNSLENIRNIHKHILITIESLRQQIHNLQQQYNKLLKMQQECTTFIHIANSTTTSTIPEGTTMNNPSITTLDQHDNANDNIESNRVVDDDVNEIRNATTIETSTTTTTTTTTPTTTNIDDQNNNNNQNNNQIVEIEMIHTISSMEEGNIDKESCVGDSSL